MIPTVGFNMRKVTKGNVAIKARLPSHCCIQCLTPRYQSANTCLLLTQLWDLGGQTRFRSMWERYCRGVNAIVFVVDAADHGTIDLARNELHNLLKPQEGKDNPLAGIPLLVLGNKKDLPGALGERELIERMDLQVRTSATFVCVIPHAPPDVTLSAPPRCWHRRVRCAPTASPVRTWSTST